MINKMISDLAALKIAIKAEERKIQTDIATHISATLLVLQLLLLIQQYHRQLSMLQIVL